MLPPVRLSENSENVNKRKDILIKTIGQSNTGETVRKLG